MKTKYSNVYFDEKNKSYFFQFATKNACGQKKTVKRRCAKNGDSFKSAKQAFNAMIEFRAEYDLLLPKNAKGLTLKCFIRNVFLPAIKAIVKDKTFRTKKNALEHIINFFGGDVKLVDVTVVDCERYRTYLMNNFARTTARNWYTIFREVFRYAERLEYLSINVASRTQTIPKKSDHTQPYWEFADFQKTMKFLESKTDYKSRMIYMMIRLYFMTGVRANEGLALRWSDVDFDQKQIKVYHNLKLKSSIHNDYELSETLKTPKSKRTIDIDDTTICALKKWKAIQQNAFHDNFIVSLDGRPMFADYVNRFLEKICDQAGVTKITMKGLRHSHTTYLVVDLHCGFEEVARRLGHSSIETTYQYYTHLRNERNETLMKKLALS